MFVETDYEVLKKCPWCEDDKYVTWGKPIRGFESVRCSNCKLIYVKNRLNSEGLKKYYKTYLSDVHRADIKLNKQRDLMYKIEFNLINTYCKKGSVLDIGCSGGYFLDYFRKSGYECYGVEFGEEAAREAIKKHQVYFGDFVDLKIDEKFDLIIFRGVIEHIPYPKLYLQKAIELLNESGFIYITSTPNSQSLCCNLFQEQWNQHEPEEHLMHFNPTHFDIFFKSNGVEKIIEHFFYEETPYANIEEDILKVAKAIKLKKMKKPISFKSPAFYGNMLSLIYKKVSCCLGGIL